MLNIANFLDFNEKNCLVWSAELDLTGEFSFTELQSKIPGGIYIDFLYDFRYDANKKNNFCVDSEQKNYTFSLRDIFSRYYPYCRFTTFQSHTSQFHLEGKISFKCGMIVNTDFRNEILKKSYKYPYISNNNILYLNQGIYTTSVYLDEMARKKAQDEKLRQELKELVDSMILFPL
jgi:hypothetical protein